MLLAPRPATATNSVIMAAPAPAAASTAPQTETPAPQTIPETEMSTDEPQEETAAEPAPKKRALESIGTGSEIAQLETRLEARIDDRFTKLEALIAATDARLGKLEQLIGTSFQKVEAKFEFIEQTLLPIVRHPTFAPMFTNHPYTQDQQQPFTLAQSWPPTTQQQQ